MLSNQITTQRNSINFLTRCVIDGYFGYLLALPYVNEVAIDIHMISYSY